MDKDAVLFLFRDIIHSLVVATSLILILRNRKLCFRAPLLLPLQVSQSHRRRYFLQGGVR